MKQHLLYWGSLSVVTFSLVVVLFSMLSLFFGEMIQSGLFGLFLIPFVYGYLQYVIEKKKHPYYFLWFLFFSTFTAVSLFWSATGMISSITQHDPDGFIIVAIMIPVAGVCGGCSWWLWKKSERLL